jgi:hypothetical protein
MSRSLTITPVGLNRIVQQLRKFPSELAREVNTEFQAAATDVEQMAKRNLATNKSVDEGRLLNAIHSGRVGENWEVGVGVSYAPFVEFGTKKRFQPTRGFENYAKQFKGARVGGIGGSLDEAILGWVKRKKIRFEKAAYADKNYRTGRSRKVSTMKQRYLTPEQTAFIIARFISFHGVKAHPYLFPAFVKVRRDITPKIVDAVRRAFRK